MVSLQKRLKEANWRLASCIPRQKIPIGLRDWLLDVGSTTHRIQHEFGEKQRARLVKQQWSLPQHSEAQLLKLPPRTHALIREAELFIGAKPWMVARTVFPPQTLSGKAGSRLAFYLDSRPLGLLLFQKSTTQRSQFELAVLQPENIEYQWAMQTQTALYATNVWARRSIIMFAHQPLLLTEVFLPGIFYC